MAATVSHHQLHFQQQIHHQQIEQQPSPPSPPKSTSSSSSLSSSFLHAELSHSSEHFCKDCGVMFESSTSLEVHLSYHKENLLTRWANQDSSSSSSEKSGVVSNPSSSPQQSNNNNSSSSSLSEPNSMSDMSTSGSSTNSHPPTPHSIDSNPNSGSNAGSGGASQQQQRFFPNNGNNNSNEPHHGQFPQSQYGSSTSSNEDQQQQHSMDHSYRQQGMNSNNYNQPPPPVDMNNHINGNVSHHSPYHSPIIIAQNHLFSPNHNVLPPNNHHSQHQPPPPPSGEPHRGQPSNTEQGTAAAIRESAEILDLDSHKVHVYQPPIPDRHFFHSPYGLPPMFGNGWSHGLPPDHQFAHSHHPPPPPPHPGFADHHAIPPYSLHGQNPPGQPPPPPHHQPPVYEMDRGNPQFSSEPPSMEYPPPPTTQAPPSQPPTSAQNQVGPPPFGQPNGGPGFTPLAAQAADNRQERISLNSPLAPSPAQKSPNEATTPAGSAAAVAAKTKGWKGGECKRPKTYNCTACNKWFTSSGHLKRHYGTTLHKNSIKQKDLPEDPPPPPKRGKNGMNKQAQAAAAAAAAANNNNAEMIRDRSPMKDFGMKGNEGSNGRSGYVPSPPVIQHSPAPPKISPHRQVDDMDKANGPTLHHKPPSHMVGSSPAFSIPSGFKYDTQALNADNSSIEHHNAGFLPQIQPPSQQRLFNPGMGHHQFYSMPHAPPPFMNGFAPDPSGLQNGPPPPSSQYAG